MEDKYTVQTAMRWIVEQQGREVFKKELIINSTLADLAAEQESERRKIRLALTSGAGSMFYGMLLHSNGSLQTQDVRRFRSNLVDYGFTQEFADYVLNVFLFSVSMPEIAENRRGASEGEGNTEEKPKPDPPRDPLTEMPLDKILEIANGYQATQDYNREIYLLEFVLDKYPDNAEIYNMLGIAHRNIGNHPQALRYYQKALYLEPENGSFLMNKAIALMTSGMAKEARVSFEKAIVILKRDSSPSYAAALGNYAYALALEGDTEKAVDTLKTAAKLGYQNAEIMRRKLEELGIYYH